MTDVPLLTVYPRGMDFPKYPEIALLHRRLEILTVKQVVATEKLHGSNLRILFPMGMTTVDDIVYGSREMIHTEPGFPLNRAVECFMKRHDLNRPWEVIKSYGFSDCTLFGEAYGPGIKAKGVKYSDGQEPLFRAFDIMVGQNFLTYDLFCEVIDKMGLPRVHEVWRGDPNTEAFEALLDQPSTEGLFNGIQDRSNLAEGVVIRSNPLLRNVFGEWLIIKHKGSKFTEVAEAPSPPKTRTNTPADDFVAAYVTEGRLLNALGRLHDRGVVLSQTMKDMPVLLTEMVADLHKECAPEWQATGLNDKALLGAVSKVLGPLYRLHLETNPPS